MFVHLRTKLQWLIPLVCVGMVIGTYELVRTFLSPSSIEVSLNVQVDNQRVLALLMFVNRSNQPVYIDENKAFLRIGTKEDSPLDSSAVLEVRTGGVRLSGTLEQRKLSEKTFWGRVNPRRAQEQFTMLAPGETKTAVVELTRKYEFLVGNHEYAVTYDASHRGPQGNPLRLVSNTVQFAYNALGD